MKHLLRGLVSAALTTVSMLANAVVLSLDASNKLIGATGIMVNGTAYDVRCGQAPASVAVRPTTVSPNPPPSPCLASVSA